MYFVDWTGNSEGAQSVWAYHTMLHSTQLTYYSQRNCTAQQQRLSSWLNLFKTFCKILCKTVYATSGYDLVNFRHLLWRYHSVEKSSCFPRVNEYSFPQASETSGWNIVGELSVAGATWNVTLEQYILNSTSLCLDINMSHTESRQDCVCVCARGREQSPFHCNVIQGFICTATHT